MLLGVCTSPMLVHLAGVELTPEGREWLQKNLAPAQTVWLKLISREDDKLHCLVSQSRVRHLITKIKGRGIISLTTKITFLYMMSNWYCRMCFPYLSRRGRCLAIVWTKRSFGWVWLAVHPWLGSGPTLASTGVSSNGCTGQRSKLRGKGGDCGRRTAYGREPPRQSGTMLYSDWWGGFLRGLDTPSDFAIPRQNILIKTRQLTVIFSTVSLVFPPDISKKAQCHPSLICHVRQIYQWMLWKRKLIFFITPVAKVCGLLLLYFSL